MELSNTISLFDGMAAGLLALKRAGIAVKNYYASEIDKNSVSVAKANHPEIKHIGDVRNLTYFGGRLWRGEWNEKTQTVHLNFDTAEIIHDCEVDGPIDLLIGGSPCQGFSASGKQQGFSDPRSKLFWHYVRLLKQIRSENPELKFLLENVKMKKAWVAVITEALGVEPIEINSALVSAQNRKRLYWTNIEGVEQPEDRGIFLSDITNDKSRYACAVRGRYKPDGSTYQKLELSDREKSNALTTVKKDSMVHDCYTGKQSRHFTDEEREALQTLPAGYTEGFPGRAKMIGNGWTVDVIAHIFSYLNQSSSELEPHSADYERVC